MDFWEHQDAARRRTVRLVGLYAVLMLLLALVAGYAIDILCQVFLDDYHDSGFIFRALFSLRPYLIALGFLAVTGFLCLLSPASLAAGGKSVAEGLKAALVTPQTRDNGEQRLLNVVEEMALASGMPVPPVYILKNEPGINAFAAGCTMNDAVIGVTRGAVDHLNREELQAVVGHEFSHVLNGDVKLDLRFVQLLFGLMCLSDFCAAVMRGISLSARPRRNSRDSGKAVVFLLLLVAVVYLAGAVMAFVGSLIQAAVNRQREFLADASAVQFTRSDALASALKKIGGLTYGSQLINTQMTASFRHLFFSPIHGSLFSTHPPLATRIRRLDPQWDGRFPDMSGIPAGSDESDPALNFNAPLENGWKKQFAASPSGLPRQESAPDRAAAVPAAMSVTGREAELFLQEACRDPLDASRMILGLLLDVRPEIRGKQLEATGSEEARQAVQAYCGAFAVLSPEKYVPLIELAIPALKNLSPEQFDNLQRLLKAFVDMDGEFSFKEWILYQLIVTQVGAQFTPRPKGVPADRESVHDAAAMILSALAGLTPGERGEKETYAAGARVLGLSVSFTGKERNPEQLSRGVAILAGQSAKTREQIMRAVVAVVMHDNAVTPEETMFLRVLSLCLGIPVPPMRLRNANDPWEKYRSR